MRITIVTSTYNSADVLDTAAASIRAQARQRDIEWIVVDGGSTDGTIERLEQLDLADQWISEPDEGVYDALNKAVELASGDIFGVLHSDDFFADPNVLADILATFETNPEIDAVYGDLKYVAPDDTSRTWRFWRAGAYSGPALRAGWMPPHPTFFAATRVMREMGGYDLQYRIASDYDFLVRFFMQGYRAQYLQRLITCMRRGGASNKSFNNILIKMREDYRIAKTHELGGLRTVALKNLRKVHQLFGRHRASER